MSGEAEWGRELVIKLSEALPVLPDAKHIILGLSFTLYTTYGFYDNNYRKEKSQELIIKINTKVSFGIVVAFSFSFLNYV